MFLPQRVIMEIEQMMRGFLWCHGDMQRGKAKVAWEIVCLPEEEGGLGIKRLETFNVALLTIHIWKLLIHKQSLWVKWIHTYKLKNRNFWEIPEKGSMTWGWRKILHIRSKIQRFVWFQLGNGMSANAWYDTWDDYCPLIKHVTTRQIANAGFDLDAKVAHVIMNNEWIWPINWSVNVPDTPPALHLDTNDILVWKDRNGLSKDFTVHQVWEDLRYRQQPVSWAHIVWFSQCIPKHAFILWLVFHRKLKTQDVMLRWDYGPNIGMLVCPLCNAQPDSHDHLFFECSFSKQVWTTVQRKANLDLNYPAWFDVIARVLLLSKKPHVQSVVPKLVLAATVYMIWNERNARLFQQSSRTSDQLVNIIMATIRLKLMTFRFKKSYRMEKALIAWDLPPRLLVSSHLS